MERGTRGVSHLPGARQTTGNRHSLSPSDAEPSRAARHGPLYPGSRMAGGHDQKVMAHQVRDPPQMTTPNANQNNPPAPNRRPPRKPKKSKPHPRQIDFLFVQV